MTLQEQLAKAEADRANASTDWNKARADWRKAEADRANAVTDWNKANDEIVRILTLINQGESK